MSEPMVGCMGDECGEEVEDRLPCDECEDEDTLCLENCWSKELPEMTKPKGKGRQKSKKIDSQVLVNGRQDHRGGKKPMTHKKMMMMMKKNKMQGKPGRKIIRMTKPGMEKTKLMKRRGMMGYQRHMGPMKYGMKPMMGPMKYGMKPMMGPMKYGLKVMMGPMKYEMKPMMGPMKYGMKPMMGPIEYEVKSMMGSMKHGMKPITYDIKYVMDKKNYMMRNKMMAMKYPMLDQNMMMDKMMKYRMETGPIMQNDKTLRGEFYTKVIFVRNGTCNAIVRDLSCFGQKKNVRMLSGRVGKTAISVPMCPRPTIMKKTTAQFTCDTGASFLKPVFVPMKCSYAPCNPGFWLPDWSDDQYWNGDNSYPGDYWGSKDWWKFDKRDENKNWFIANGDRNRVDKD